MKQLTDTMLDDLSLKAQQSPRLRAHHNVHEELSAPVQRLAIAMEPDTVVLPHRHPHTWEILFPLRGRFVVLTFDEAGTVTGRTTLGAGCKLLELPPGEWHGVLSLDQGGVIFEVKQGAYVPVGEADSASWGKAVEGAALLAWYAKAGVGDRMAAVR